MQLIMSLKLQNPAALLPIFHYALEQPVHIAIASLTLLLVLGSSTTSKAPNSLPAPCCVRQLTPSLHLNFKYSFSASLSRCSFSSSVSCWSPDSHSFINFICTLQLSTQCHLNGHIFPHNMSFKSDSNSISFLSLFPILVNTHTHANTYIGERGSMCRSL